MDLDVLTQLIAAAHAQQEVLDRDNQQRQYQAEVNKLNSLVADALPPGDITDQDSLFYLIIAAEELKLALSPHSRSEPYILPSERIRNRPLARLDKDDVYYERILGKHAGWGWTRAHPVPPSTPRTP
jgi:hypothetical protein